MQENYKILGLTEFATDAEIDQAYNTLKEKYQRERFYEGEIGNQAAKNLTMLESAYREIKTERNAKNDDQCCFADVERLIKEGDIASAQNKLDEYSDRNAEWHYLQAVIFYKKNWNNESKKQLEIALSIDSDNKKYLDAYSKLKQKMAYSERRFESAPNDQEYNRQMGGGSNDCMSMCITWCCINMMCNGCCR